MAADGQRARRAAVSSFGFSGTNAHMVVEEAPAAPPRAADGDTWRIVALSAKSADALAATRDRLDAWLDSAVGRTVALADVSHTLLRHRTHFEAREAFVVRSVPELRDAVRRRRDGEAVPGWISGRVDPSAARPDALVEAARRLVRELSDPSLDAAARRSTCVALAELHVNGVEVPWDDLQGPEAGRVVSLPTYPFARERYTPEDERWRDGAAPGAAPRHPDGRADRPDRTDRDGRRQSTVTVLSGSEYPVADHVIGNDRMLPGVAYLELARAAAERAAGRPVRGLRHVVWLRSLVVGADPVAITTRVTALEEGAAFAVSTGAPGREICHARGRVVFDALASPPDALDIDGIRERCPGRMTGEAHYGRAAALDLNLGPTFRTVREIAFNGNEALAWLERPEASPATAWTGGLDAALLDGALQSLICLMPPGAARLHVPFSVDDVVLRGPLTSGCWAHVRVDDTDGPVRRCDIRVANEAGAVQIELKGFVARALGDRLEPGAGGATQLSGAPVPNGDRITTLYARPSWRPAPPARPGPAGTALLAFTRSDATRVALAERAHAVVARVEPGASFAALGPWSYAVRPDSLEDYRRLVAELRGRGAHPATVLYAWGEWPMTTTDSIVPLDDELRHAPFALIAALRALAEQRTSSSPRLVLAWAEHAGVTNPFQAALHAIGATAVQEGAAACSRGVALPAAIFEDPQRLAAILLDEVPAVDGGTSRYLVSGPHGSVDRQVREWQAYEPDRSAGDLVLSTSRPYLITGGLGRIGRHIVLDLARRGAGRLAICGRSALTAATREELEAVRALGADVSYFETDLADPAAVSDLVARIGERYGALAGVIHAAGVTNDGLLEAKTPERLAGVLAPKVDGTWHLDAATADLPLDFFILLSSVAGVRGNVGQADYAYANAFLDAFCDLRESWRAQGRRRGRTCAIDSGLWHSSGLQIPAATLRTIARATGMVPMDTAAGLDAVWHALTAPSRFIVVQGEEGALRRTFTGGAAVEAAIEPSAAPLAGPSASFPAEVTLRRLVARALRIELDRVNETQSLTSYGMDSITFVELADALNDELGLDLSPAVFFEHPSIASLAAHLRSRLPRPVELPAPDETRSRCVRAAVRRTARTSARQTGSRHRSYRPTRNGAETTPAPIAIVGMSGVMPGSSDLEAFWRHLDAGADLIDEIPADRWDWRAVAGDPATEPNKTNSRWGGFIADVDRFDAGFFAVSPREAALMDPQHRIFLELVWKAIEDAGWKPSDLAGTTTGLFVGVGHSDYVELARQRELDVEAHSATGVSTAMLPNRISFLLDLHGPSEPVDTACSSSLVAVHRALQAIRSGECEMAIAGGVHVMLSPVPYIAFGKAGMLSADGRCRTFDKAASGYVRGEGAGVVFLKRLDRALADGDPIRAILTASAVNHGGRAASLTAPNTRAQADLLIKAYESAGIDPTTVSYIETHGTGTSLGDPVEVEGLKLAFAELVRRRGQAAPATWACALGSVKTNIGHLETAAGIAGLIKVVLALQHGRIPGNVHFRELNPHIRLENSPFHVVEATRPWTPAADAHGRPVRRAGVSAFGFGGANAHVVLEGFDRGTASAAEINTAPTQPVLVLLSARTEERLAAAVAQLDAFLGDAAARDEMPDLVDIGYTLRVGREAMDARIALTARSVDELRATLARIIAQERAIDGVWRGNLQDNRGAADVLSDDDALDLVARWIEKGKLAALARAWVAGLSIDWRQLAAGRGRRSRCRRIRSPAIGTGCPLPRHRARQRRRLRWRNGRSQRRASGAGPCSNTSPPRCNPGVARPSASRSRWPDVRSATISCAGSCSTRCSGWVSSARLAKPRARLTCGIGSR